jgi:hypothetical protein
MTRPSPPSESAQAVAAGMTRMALAGRVTAMPVRT